MLEHVKADETFVREDVTHRRRPRAVRAEGQDYKVELIEDLVANTGTDTRVAVHERPVHRPLPRTARTVHEDRQGVQAAVGRRRLLARRLRPHAC